MAERPLLGEVLLQAGVIDELQLSRALGEQHRWGGRLGLALLRLGFVEEAELLKALSRQLGVPAVRLGTKRVAPEALELVPAELAEKYRCLPLFLKRDGGREILHVAMEDPTDLAAIDDLSFRTGRRVRPVLMGPDELRRAMARFYGGGSSDPEHSTGFAETPLESGDTAPDVTGAGRSQEQAPDVAAEAGDAGATVSAAAGPDASAAAAAAEQSAAELSAGLSGADPESSLAPGFEPEEILAAASELVAQGERNAKTQTGGVAVDVEDAPIATSVAPPPSEPELSAQEAEAELAAGALDVSVDLGDEGEDPLGVSGGDDDPATVLLEPDAALPAPAAAESGSGASADSPPGSPGVSSASGASLAAEALREAQESVAAQANAPAGATSGSAEPTIEPEASGDAGSSAHELPGNRGEAMPAEPAPTDPVPALADRGVRHDRPLPPPDLSAQAVLLPLELEEELPPAPAGDGVPEAGSGSTPAALDEQDVAELAGVVPPRATAPEPDPDAAVELSDALPDDDPVLGSGSDAADLGQPGPAEAALEVRVSDGPTHEPHVDVDHIGDSEPVGTAPDPGDSAPSCVSATSLVAPPNDLSTDAEDWLTAPAAVSAADIGEQAAAAAAASLGESASGSVSAELAAPSLEEEAAAAPTPTPVPASVSGGAGDAPTSAAEPAPFSTRDVLRALTELLIEKQVLEPGELVARVRAVRAGATSAD